MASYETWQFDRAKGGHVFCGDAEVVAAAREYVLRTDDRPTLSALLRALGLQLPATIPDCALSILGPEQTADADGFDARLQTQLGQLQVQEPRQPAEDLARIGHTRPLPPYDEAVKRWRSFLSDCDVGETSVEAAVADAEEFICKRSDPGVLNPGFLGPQEDPATALLSGFLYSYEFTSPVFWAVWRGQRWRVHPLSDRIEAEWEKRGRGEELEAAVATELVDFETMTSSAAGRPPQQLRRVSESLPLEPREPQIGDVEREHSATLNDDVLREVSASDAEICRFKQTVWWAVGSSTGIPTVTRDGAGDWAEKDRGGDGGWQDAPGPSAHALEHLWSGRPAPWQPTLDVKVWLEGGSVRSPRRSTVGISQPRAELLSPGAAPPSSRRKSVSRRAGSVLLRMQAEQPPEPGLGRAGMEGSGAWGGRPPPHRKEGSEVPALVMLLRQQCADDEEIRELIQSMEEVPRSATDSAQSLVSFRHELLVRCEERRMQLFCAYRLWNPLGLDVPSLLTSKAATGPAKMCLSMVHRTALALPEGDPSGLKQLPPRTVDTRVMDMMRRGRVLVNRGVLALRPTVACNVSALCVNVEFVAANRDLSSVARLQRRCDSLLPPCVLEVVTDLSMPSSSKGRVSPGGVTLKEIGGSQIIQARLRQLVADCEDVRLSSALGEIMEGAAHVHLRHTDPQTAAQEIKVGKQPREGHGISMLIPLRRTLPVHQLTGRAPQQPDEGVSTGLEMLRVAVGGRRRSSLEVGPSLCNVPLGRLRAPLRHRVLVAQVDHASPAERFGIVCGQYLDAVDREGVVSVADARRALTEKSRGSRELVVKVSSPTAETYAVWEVRGGGGVWHALPESSVLEEAYQNWRQSKEHQSLRYFAVDSPYDCTVVVNSHNGECFTDLHLGRDLLDTLMLEVPDSSCEWHRGKLPPNSIASVVGSVKVTKLLCAGTSPARVHGATASADEAGSKDAERELDETEAAFAKECAANMRYPPPEVVAALDRFRDAPRDGGASHTKAAALLVETFWWGCLPGPGGTRRLGRSAGLMSTRWFARWYRLTGLRQQRPTLYYCVNLATTNKLCVVHHNTVRVKDTRLYDFEQSTRKILLNGDEMKWMLDVVRRVERVVPAAVGDDAVELIARALELRPPGVTNISLEGNGLTDACIPHLVSILIHNPSIRHIGLEHNPQVRNVHKDSLSCLIRCNELACPIDHEDLDCIELQQYVALRREELLPPGDIRTIVAKNALAALHQKGARFEEAERLFKEAWQLAASQQATTRSLEMTQAVATILYNLGTLYLLRGDFASGREVFLQSFEGVMAVAGPSHPTVWRMLTKYADFYTEQREYKKALFWYSFASRELRSCLGPRSDLIAEAEYRAAAVHASMGSLRRAVAALLGALHILRVQLTKPDESVFLCLHRLASVLFSMAYEPLCEKLHEEALHGLEEAYAARHVRLSQLAHGTLTVAQFYAGRAEASPPGAFVEELYTRASELFEAAARHFAQLVPDKHPENISLALHHASTLTSLGRVRDAHQILARQWENAREALGDHHPITADALRLLGRLSAKAGRPQDAVSFLEQARVALVGSGTADRGATMADVYYDLGKALTGRMRFREAEEALRNCLRIRTALYGINHDLIATTFLALAELYRRMGMYEDAEDFAKRHTTLRLGKYPESRAWLLHAVEFLAETRLSQGKVHEAAQLRDLKRVVDDRALVMAHGDRLERGVTRLRGMLKEADAVYQLGEVSWDARTSYLAARASRSFPVDLLQHLPVFGPRTASAEPLSSVERLLRLHDFPGLLRLVRFPRAIRPAEPWTGIRRLELAVVTKTELSAFAIAAADGQQGHELAPAMFGGDESEEPVWRPAEQLIDPALERPLDAFLVSGAVPDGAATEHPLLSSLAFVGSQFQALQARKQRAAASELCASTEQGLRRRFFKQLVGFVRETAVAAAIAEKRQQRRASIGAPQETRRGSLRPRDVERRA
eukprot:TRINITY_DN13095_c0_g1_i1.p1 TRINITY_DN13095_c0_g1~~TRINITY_DN13095_c0_g1_i1.p1  ORF type:complete len:1971 (+),score=714.92 TRINITY_DN13095_c0_g1_i1:66-5978(+)